MMREAERVRDVLRAMDRPVSIAVSGGVDSLTLAALADGTLGGERVIMHHAVSPAVPGEATARVRTMAEARGWTLDLFEAGEFSDPQYRANPVNRCFFCKTNLYGGIAARAAGRIILSGTNTDDLGEYRPGLDAARRHDVRHPFVEAGVAKSGVRAIAASLGLGDVSSLPASPCLASRVETGIAIEAADLRMIETTERVLRETIAPRTVRCRLRASGIVIELDEAALGRVRDGRMQEMQEIVAAASGRNVAVIFAPYRTGSAFLHGTATP